MGRSGIRVDILTALWSLGEAPAFLGLDGWQGRARKLLGARHPCLDHVDLLAIIISSGQHIINKLESGLLRLDSSVERFDLGHGVGQSSGQLGDSGAGLLLVGLAKPRYFLGQFLDRRGLILLLLDLETLFGPKHRPNTPIST